MSEQEAVSKILSQDEIESLLSSSRRELRYFLAEETAIATDWFDDVKEDLESADNLKKKEAEKAQSRLEQLKDAQVSFTANEPSAFDGIIPFIQEDVDEIKSEQAGIERKLGETYDDDPVYYEGYDTYITLLRAAESKLRTPEIEDPINAATKLFQETRRGSLQMQMSLNNQELRPKERVLTGAIPEWKALSPFLVGQTNIK